MLSPDYKLVVAFDIGTTYSAYAYAEKKDIDFKKNDINITCNDPWNSGQSSLTTDKTPTSVLLIENEKKIRFGYKAENKYAELIPTSDMPLADENGKMLLAETVFAKAISALKDEFEEAIKTTGIDLNDEDIRWVITVPAIWSEAAKQFMRKCAHSAGIPGNQLIIALEPEAASIYCQNIPSKDKDEDAITVFKEGTQYMVVDLGGGTVDIAVHEKLGKGFLCEIHHATGDDCGGHSVNTSLVEEFRKIFGKPLIDDVEKIHPLQFFNIHREFEAAKKVYDPLENSGMQMRIPYSFLKKLCQNMNQNDFEQMLLNSEHGDRITMDDDFVFMDPNLVSQQLFEPTAKRVCELISQIICKVDDSRLTKILLVGGFADSKYIQHAVRTKFPNMKVIVPKHANLCVVKGAVMFGHSPHLISHRVSRFTYGTEVSALFDNEKHDQKRKDIVDGEKRCTGVFSIFTTAGTVLERDTTIERTYSTVQKYQKSIDLSIFMSTKEHPMYIDEEECTKIGNFHLKLKQPTEEKRSVQVTVVFGNTELKVRAVDKISGENCDASFELPLF
ncbi:heat shock 70 kDa protein 12A-like [Mytilus trossulus]|uniref:heat shock 70 kDa protein 12A-like n=1 Tax=Mytilus trossulus TaxID=6551 RepID=UPI003003D362